MSWDGSYPDRPGLGAGLEERTLLGKLPRGAGARSKALLPADLDSSWPQRPPHGFLVNMKLEAVDRRTPSFIRVASVEDVEDHRIKVGAGVSVLSLRPGTVLAPALPNSLPVAVAKCVEVCGSTLCGGSQVPVPGSRSEGEPCAAVQLYPAARCQLGGLQSLAGRCPEV